MDDRYKSRKFILALVIVLLTSLMIWFGKIDGTVFGLIVTGVVSAYIAGNVTQKIWTEGASVTEDVK